MDKTAETGHVCYYCCSPQESSPENPARTDFCVICNHRQEGQKRLVITKEWGIKKVLKENK